MQALTINGHSDGFKGDVMADRPKDFSDLTALFINTTLTRSPGASHTQLIIDVSADIMTKQLSLIHI